MNRIQDIAFSFGLMCFVGFLFLSVFLQSLGSASHAEIGSFMWGICHALFAALVGFIASRIFAAAFMWLYAYFFFKAREVEHD